MAQEQYCTFGLDSLMLGLPVVHVQEVIRHQQITGVPLSKRTVSGLMNLRGQIVSALDLRRRFAIDAPFPRQPMSLIVVVHGESIALLVDEIGDVITAEPADFEPVPETLGPPASELVRSVLRTPGGLLLLLDLDAAIQFAAVV